MCKIYWLILLCCTAISGFAQWQPEIGISRGYVIPHRAVMQHLQQGHATHFQFSLLKTKQQTHWGRSFINPRSGFSFFLVTMGNQQELGNAYSVQYQFSTDLFRWKNPLTLSLAAGVGWLGKNYHVVENPKNIAIGSKVNASIYFALMQQFAIGNQRFGVNLAIGHYSNAAYKAPNLGVNIPTIGLMYLPNKPTVQKFAIEKEDREQPAVTELVVDVGFKELPVAGGSRYTNVAFALQHTLASKHISSFDYFLYGASNSSIPAALENEVDLLDGSRPELHKNAALQFGLGVGYRALFGKTSVFIHQGFYLFSKQPGIGKLFHRVGVKQVVNAKWSVQMILKSHFAKAEYIGLGLGYNFRNKAK